MRTHPPPYISLDTPLLGIVDLAIQDLYPTFTKIRIRIHTGIRDASFKGTRSRDEILIYFTKMDIPRSQQETLPEIGIWIPSKQYTYTEMKNSTAC